MAIRISAPPTSMVGIHANVPLKGLEIAQSQGRQFALLWAINYWAGFQFTFGRATEYISPPICVNRPSLSPVGMPFPVIKVCAIRNIGEMRVGIQRFQHRIHLVRSAVQVKRIGSSHKYMDLAAQDASALGPHQLHNMRQIVIAIINEIDAQIASCSARPERYSRWGRRRRG